MDIEYLKEFVALGKFKSLANAAQHLNVAPSTLGRHLSALEHDLDEILVRRSTIHFELTPEGEVFLEGVIIALDQYEAAREAARRSRRERTSLVVIGGHLRSAAIYELVSAAVSLMTVEHLPVVAELRPSHLVSSNAQLATQDFLDDLRTSAVDVSVMVACRQLDSSEFGHQRLFREPFAVFVPKGHRLTEGGPASLADLSDETIITNMAYPSFSHRIVEACKQSGFEPRIRTRIARSSGEMYVCKGNDEIFIVPQCDAIRIAPPAISGLVRLEIEDENAYFEVEAVYRKDCANLGVSAFLDALDRANTDLGRAGLT